MSFSDNEVDAIIKNVEKIYSFHKLPKSAKAGFVNEVKNSLLRSGVIENICPLCLGSGMGDYITTRVKDE